MDFFASNKTMILATPTPNLPIMFLLFEQRYIFF